MAEPFDFYDLAGKKTPVEGRWPAISGTIEIFDIVRLTRVVVENFGRLCCKNSGRPFAGLTGLAHAICKLLASAPASTRETRQRLSAGKWRG